MKRNVISALAVLSMVAVFAAPAMADLNAYTVAGPNAVPFPGQGGRSDVYPMNFGIVNAPGTALLSPYQVISAAGSSTISVTFGVSWVYSQPYRDFFYGGVTAGGT